MSNRDSLGFGDLIPQDVAEVFAQERFSKGRRKKRSKSLGRAFGWLKGKKRKNIIANGQSLGLGPGPNLALDGPPAAGPQGGQKAGKQGHPPGNSHAVLKQEAEDKTVPSLFQENVFVEASRPKYVEDLHNEAQEGLKLMQQEETDNGVDYRDDESTISTVQQEEDGGGFLSDSTIPDASSMVSTQSTRSSHSGITRQGSTFRPLNSGNMPEKAKNRRRHRKTVMGIPHHVQKELGLDRVGWTVKPVLDEEQLCNDETADNATVDGAPPAPEPQEQASVNKSESQQISGCQVGHRDDLALLQLLGPELSALQRPRSLAVPWMTTANTLLPPSPVMSMSPQATYLSKIIPNAVMPPSIEVVEIKRGRSRNSLRTVSKSSLLLASPASSRASSRVSCGRASTLSSASHSRLQYLSDSSGWSRAESSETLVSNSSTISSSSTPRQKESDEENSPPNSSSREDKVSIYSSISKASKTTSNGKPRSKGIDHKKEGAFVRSLSVMKSKRAPTPPSRSYSLHNKMKRRSRDLAEVRVVSRQSSPLNTLASSEKSGGNDAGESKVAFLPPMSSVTTDSPGYTADTSSLDDSTGSVSISPLKSQLQAPEKEVTPKTEEPDAKDTLAAQHQPPVENGIKITASPSSGYSSQAGTPNQASKPPDSSSPRHKRGFLAKLQSIFPGSSPAPAVSAPSPLTQTATPESSKPGQSPVPPIGAASASPSVKALRELFNIPAPPKIHAPPPPPPEVWVHNKRTFELLLGPPAPSDTYAAVKKNPKDRRQQRPSPSISRDGSNKSSSSERKGKRQILPTEISDGNVTSLVTRKVQESEQLNLESKQVNNGRLSRVEQCEDGKGISKVTGKREMVNGRELAHGMLVEVIEKYHQRRTALQKEQDKTATPTQSSVSEVKTNTETLSTATSVFFPPSPTSTPAHQVPLPPTIQHVPVDTAGVPSSQATGPAAPPIMESSWPPPPPPMEQATVTLLSGNEVMDFPLPPPPILSEEGLVLPDNAPPVQVPLVQAIPHVNIVQESDIQQCEPAQMKTSVATSVEKAVRPNVATEVAQLTPKDVRTAAQPVAPKLKLTVSVHQGIPPPPQSIPPPPPFSAPAPPAKEVLPPPLQEIPPSLPQEMSALKERIVGPPPPLESDSFPSALKLNRPPESIPPPPETQTVVSTAPSISPPPPPSEAPPPFCEAPLSTDYSDPAAKELSTLPPSLTPLTTSVESPPPATVCAPTDDTHQPLPDITDNQSKDQISTTMPGEAPTSMVTPPLLQMVKLRSVNNSTDSRKPQEEVQEEVQAEVVKTRQPNNLVPLENLSVVPEHRPSQPADISAPLPAQAPAKIAQRETAERKSNEQISAPAQEEDSSSPSPLQTVKMRTVNNSSDSTVAQGGVKVQPEAAAEGQQPNHPIAIQPSSGEAPQKPIRRSLIMLSPTHIAPPAIVTPQAAIVKSQSAVVPPSSPALASPTNKSPPATIPSSSMNLQEAIRLRTAARTTDGPSPRRSLQPPVSPLGGDIHKSPSSTASFIFSKSTKRVVIETTSPLETQAHVQKKLAAEMPSVSKPVVEAESEKKAVRVPPPVAKKPKAKVKDAKNDGETEKMPTAGQEAQRESKEGTPEKPNGTAGGIEGGKAST